MAFRINRDITNKQAFKMVENCLGYRMDHNEDCLCCPLYELGCGRAGGDTDREGVTLMDMLEEVKP